MEIYGLHKLFVDQCLLDYNIKQLISETIKANYY